MATRKRLLVEPGLRLAISARGGTAGRRGHLIRLRESLYHRLKEVADGPFYLLVEQAVKHWVEHLESQSPSTLKVLRDADVEVTSEDILALEQWEAKANAVAKAAAAKNKRPVGRPPRAAPVPHAPVLKRPVGRPRKGT